MRGTCPRPGPEKLAVGSAQLALPELNGPWDEQARLASLRELRVVGRPPEPRFDSIVRCAGGPRLFTADEARGVDGPTELVYMWAMMPACGALGTTSDFQLVIPSRALPRICACKNEDHALPVQLSPSGDVASLPHAAPQRCALPCWPSQPGAADWPRTRVRVAAPTPAHPATPAA
jgi:hypothetical protein